MFFRQYFLPRWSRVILKRSRKRKRSRSLILGIWDVAPFSAWWVPISFLLLRLCPLPAWLWFLTRPTPFFENEWLLTWAAVLGLCSHDVFFHDAFLLQFSRPRNSHIVQHGHHFGDEATLLSHAKANRLFLTQPVHNASLTWGCEHFISTVNLTYIRCHFVSRLAMQSTHIVIVTIVDG